MIFAADKAGERLDVFLTRMQPEFSRSHVQKLIASGNATVNQAVRKGNYKLKAGDEVELSVPEPENTEILPEDIPLDILYEDKDIIVINKARGMVVHPAAGVFSGTLVNALMHHCDDLSGINGEIRPGIVHRLDKDTSGVMVAAKNDQAHLSLAKQIQEKTAFRIYQAVVWGNIKEEAGIIRGDIGRDASDRKKNGHRQGKRQACCHPFPGAGAFWRVYADGVQAGNRTHPSDTRPHDLYRPPGGGGPEIRHGQARQGEGQVCHQGAGIAFCQPGAYPSGYRGKAALCSPIAAGYAGTD